MGARAAGQFISHDEARDACVERAAVAEGNADPTQTRNAGARNTKTPSADSAATIDTRFWRELGRGMATYSLRTRSLTFQFSARVREARQGRQLDPSPSCGRNQAKSREQLSGQGDIADREHTGGAESDHQSCRLWPGISEP